MAEKESFGKELGREMAKDAYAGARKATIAGAFVAGTAVAGPVGGAVAAGAVLVALNADTIRGIVDANRKSD